MTLDKITSSIYNDIQSGLAGFSTNPTISMSQLEDEVVEKRQVVIKELVEKGLLKADDLAVSLNCVEIDCENMAKCDCGMQSLVNKSKPHFEIPRLLTDIGEDAVIYIGSADGMIPYRVYYSMETSKSNQYRRRGNSDPYVYVDTTVNANQMHDCWVFNAPLAKQLKVIGVFKDLRQLEEFDCCRDFEYLDFGIISDEVKNRVKQDKFAFYRQNLAKPHLTDTMYR